MDLFLRSKAQTFAFNNLTVLTGLAVLWKASYELAYILVPRAARASCWVMNESQD
jgi:hypothetical protein